MLFSVDPTAKIERFTIPSLETHYTCLKCSNDSFFTSNIIDLYTCTSCGHQEDEWSRVAGYTCGDCETITEESFGGLCEACHLKMLSNEPPCDELYYDEGFDLVQTGGGCTGYQKNKTDGGYILVTQKEDCSAPTIMSEPVTVGHYDKHGEWLEALTEEHSDTVEYFMSQENIDRR